MDNDFRGGQIKTRVIEPLNKQNEQRLPTYNSLDGSGTSEPSQTQQAVVSSAFTPEVPIGPQPPLGPKRSRLTLPQWKLSKRTSIILAVVAVLLIGGGVCAALLLQPSDKKVAVVAKKTVPEPAPAPPVIISNLTGVPVDASVNARPVTGVMIENSEDARPQSGMDQAGIVFEAIAEGGITRFLTLYQDGTPDYIGPVRSARPYYVQWCMAFDCAYAHAGGSNEGLQSIQNWGTKDLPHNASAFWRINSRYAPHNLYTSIAKLNEYAASKSYGAPAYTPLARKKDAASQTPNASSIDFNISSYMFNAHFDYDAASNSYKRSQAGAPHMVVNGAGAETQLQPKTVVALLMSYSTAGIYSVYGSNGSGEAYVFQDGTIAKGTWHKADAKSALTLTDTAGQPLALNAGQTWFTALSGPDRIGYK